MRNQIGACFFRAWLGLGLLLHTVGGAAELNLKLLDKTLPQEIDPSITNLLSSKALQLLDGEKPAYELWLRDRLPLKSKPSSTATGLASLAETTLIGIMVVGSGQRDYKDNDIASGAYTVRFALQPQDGNHLGTAEFSYFAVLTPVKTDTKPDGITTYKALVKASGKDTSTGHPVVLSLRPASAPASEPAKLVQPAADHKAVQIRVPAQVADSDETAELHFQLVYEGKGHA
jgi:hypothetical protein